MIFQSLFQQQSCKVACPIKARQLAKARVIQWRAKQSRSLPLQNLTLGTCLAHKGGPCTQEQLQSLEGVCIFHLTCMSQIQQLFESITYSLTPLYQNELFSCLHTQQVKTSDEPRASFIYLYILSALSYQPLVHVMYSINACQDEWNRTAFYHVIWVSFQVTTFPFASFICVVRKTEFKGFTFENGSGRIFTAVDIIIRSKKKSL